MKKITKCSLECTNEGTLKKIQISAIVINGTQQKTDCNITNIVTAIQTIKHKSYTFYVFKWIHKTIKIAAGK